MDIVTGATGYIGNVLVRQLLNKGRAVRTLVRPTSDLTSLKGLKIEKAIGNILDIDSLINAFREADTVYHLAANISIMPGNAKLIRKINIEGTINVIKACIKCGVRRLIYTSSIHALEEPSNGTIIDEDMPFDPYSIRGEYDRSKAQASLEVLKATRRGLDAVIVCPTGITGPYDFKVSAMSQTFINFASHRLKFIVDGAFDFVDVRDVAAGHILAANKGKTGESYILSGERVTMDGMMSILEKVTGVRASQHKVPVRLAKIIGSLAPIYYKTANKTPYFTSYSVCTLQGNSFISHRKATTQLGYFPRPIEISIRDSINWLSENKLLQAS
jgi:dihydroflavonol-4-reductase